MCNTSKHLTLPGQNPVILVNGVLLFRWVCLHRIPWSQMLPVFLTVNPASTVEVIQTSLTVTQTVNMQNVNGWSDRKKQVTVTQIKNYDSHFHFLFTAAVVNVSWQLRTWATKGQVEVMWHKVWINPPDHVLLQPMFFFTSCCWAVVFIKTSNNLLVLSVYYCVFKCSIVAELNKNRLRPQTGICNIQP